MKLGFCDQGRSGEWLTISWCSRKICLKKQYGWRRWRWNGRNAESVSGSSHVNFQNHVGLWRPYPILHQLLPQPSPYPAPQVSDTDSKASWGLWASHFSLSLSFIIYRQDTTTFVLLVWGGLQRSSGRIFACPLKSRKCYSYDYCS